MPTRRRSAPPAPSALEPANPPPGRPRSEAVTERILDAAIELLVDDGVDAVTIYGVAARTGVARATIYLRWPNREDLIVAAVRRAMGREVIKPTGDLEADLRAGAEQARVIFSSAQFLAIFPTLVRALLQARPQPNALTYDLMAPGRAAIAQEYTRLAGKSGMRTDVNPDLVTDLIIGGMINRLLVTGWPPTRADARQVVEIVLDGVRRRT